MKRKIIIFIAGVLFALGIHIPIYISNNLHTLINTLADKNIFIPELSSFANSLLISPIVILVSILLFFNAFADKKTK